MKQYDIIYADPPWAYKSKAGIGFRHASSHKYEVLTTERLIAMPVKDLAKKNSVLFLWATAPMLPDALRLMEAWGFKYKTFIVWRKIRSLGMGFWFRGQVEILLLGVRGKVKPFRMQKANFYQSTVLRHSQKPHYFRELISRATSRSFEDPAKIELFARSREGLFPDDEYRGWDVFGNEVNNSIKIEW